MIKAIETVYKGYRFRSRLEARWAVFFDAMGIKWKYEVEGFVLSNGDAYLPDFYLPGFSGDMYVEVKPDGGDFSKAKMFAEECRANMWLAEGLPRPIFYLASSTWSEFEMGWEACAPMWADAYGEYRMWWDWGCGYNPGDELPGYGLDLIDRACKAARQARFEHGENGRQ